MAGQGVLPYEQTSQRKTPKLQTSDIVENFCRNQTVLHYITITSSSFIITSLRHPKHHCIANITLLHHITSSLHHPKHHCIVNITSLLHQHYIISSILHYFTSILHHHYIILNIITSSILHHYCIIIYIIISSSILQQLLQHHSTPQYASNLHYPSVLQVQSILQETFLPREAQRCQLFLQDQNQRSEGQEQICVDSTIFCKHCFQVSSYSHQKGHYLGLPVVVQKYIPGCQISAHGKRNRKLKLNQTEIKATVGRLWSHSKTNMKDWDWE